MFTIILSLPRLIIFFIVSSRVSVSSVLPFIVQNRFLSWLRDNHRDHLQHQIADVLFPVHPGVGLPGLPEHEVEVALARAHGDEAEPAGPGNPDRAASVFVFFVDMVPHADDLVDAALPQLFSENLPNVAGRRVLLQEDFELIS